MRVPLNMAGQTIAIVRLISPDPSNPTIGLLTAIFVSGSVPRQKHIWPGGLDIVCQLIA